VFPQVEVFGRGPRFLVNGLRALVGRGNRCLAMFGFQFLVELESGDQRRRLVDSLTIKSPATDSAHSHSGALAGGGPPAFKIGETASSGLPPSSNSLPNWVLRRLPFYGMGRGQRQNEHFDRFSLLTCLHQ